MAKSARDAMQPATMKMDLESEARSKRLAGGAQKIITTDSRVLYRDMVVARR